MNNIDLRKLSEMRTNDRAFLSLYLASPDSWKLINRRLDNMRKTLKDTSDELRHFYENLKLINQYFEDNPHKKGSLCVFCCWLNDYLEVFELDISLGEMAVLDSSPYLKPLAEFQDEYENFAVAIVDNQTAKIFLVTSGSSESPEIIRGNIKNHVKVGGWSQQRYQRKRSHKLSEYAKQIVEMLSVLDSEHVFRRIILAGSGETIREIKKSMPSQLLNQVVGVKEMDLRRNEAIIEKEIFDLFVQSERKSEENLWETIKNSLLSGVLGVVGIEDVLDAAIQGRVHTALVNRNYHSEGIKCRTCEKLSIGQLEICTACNSKSVFAVDLVNEVVDLLKQSSAKIDFSDENAELKQSGSIAALLRY